MDRLSKSRKLGKKRGVDEVPNRIDYHSLKKKSFQPELNGSNCGQGVMCILTVLIERLIGSLSTLSSQIFSLLQAQMGLLQVLLFVLFCTTLLFSRIVVVWTCFLHLFEFASNLLLSLLSLSLPSTIPILRHETIPLIKMAPFCRPDPSTSLICLPL